VAKKPKKKKPKADRRTEIWHEGRKLEIPVLSAPVGPETPALKLKYPSMNQAQDVEIVDYYLSAIEAVKSLAPSATSPPEMAMQRLLGVVQKNIPWDDRAAAIRALQDVCGITDPAEKTDGLVLPGKATLLALVDLGDIAEKMLDADDGSGSKYMHPAHFDWIVFAREYAAQFHKRVAPHGLRELLGMMERDPYVLDIRWMAYMLATASIETGWTFRPVEEKGHGKLGKYKDKKKPKLFGKWNVKDYFLPVKVQLMAGGEATVTEHDGDQFKVLADGSDFVPLGSSGTRGAVAVNFATQTFNKPTETYAKNQGGENAYFGRGYCQVTWWDGYARAGFVLGRGLDFLLNPDLVLEPKVAYDIMSIGMRTGSIFANGFRISRFIGGNHCDYLHARQMVNGMSGAEEISKIAETFEDILMKAKSPLLAGN